MLSPQDILEQIIIPGLIRFLSDGNLKIYIKITGGARMTIMLLEPTNGGLLEYKYFFSLGYKYFQSDANYSF